MRLPRLIPLCRSRRLSAYLVTLHVTAFVALSFFPWPLLVQIFAGVLLCISLAHGLQNSPIVALRLGARGDLFSVLADGSRVAATVLPSSTVFSALILLRLRGDGVPAALSLLRDSFVVADDFRVLRVWLRGRATVGEIVSDDGAG